MTTPAAIYLQGAHPIREVDFAKYAEAKVRSGGRPTADWCDAVVPMKRSPR